MWIILTTDYLLSRVTAPEKAALDTAARDPRQASALAEIAPQIASQWRGKIGRWATLDKRPAAVPDELLIDLLADFRYRAFTRLPGMKSLLDELRVREWDRAMKTLDNLKDFAIAPPDPENLPDPAGSGRQMPATGPVENSLEGYY